MHWNTKFGWKSKLIQLSRGFLARHVSDVLSIELKFCSKFENVRNFILIFENFVRGIFGILNSLVRQNSWEMFYIVNLLVACRSLTGRVKFLKKSTYLELNSFSETILDAALLAYIINSECTRKLIHVFIFAELWHYE